MAAASCTACGRWRPGWRLVEMRGRGPVCFHCARHIWLRRRRRRQV